MLKKHTKKYQKVSPEKVSAEFFCKVCDYVTIYKSNLNKHNLTASHNLKVQKVSQVSTLKVSENYKCEMCDYTTIYKSNLNKHKTRASHFEVSQKVSDQLFSNFVCLCGKEYQYSSGLKKHKLKCNIVFGENTTILEILKNNNEILRDNKEFKNLIIEQNKQIIALAKEKTTIHNTQNIQNIQNNTFNLGHFLNEKCKDAMNMSDFINSINVTFDDLESTGKNGFIKSMSQCITRELQKLDIYSRPIHCSDTKRKVIHIKDKNVWDKDTDEHSTTKHFLSKINHKMNFLQIFNWKNKYPNCEYADDKMNTLYLKIVGNSSDCEDDTYEKIITNFSDKITIDKKECVNMIN
jgi:hypothetical protein